MRKLAMFVGLAFLCASAAMAAEPKKATTHAAKTTLTGCLSKGGEANTFMLEVPGAAGKKTSWELIGAPADLKLADHVGHKIEVTGTRVSKQAAERMEHAGDKTAAKAEKHEEGKEPHLKVETMKHVAPTCS